MVLVRKSLILIFVESGHDHSTVDKNQLMIFGGFGTEIFFEHLSKWMRTRETRPAKQSLDSDMNEK